MTAALPRRLRQSDRDRVMITPEGIALPLTLASRGTRAGALVLDLMLPGVDGLEICRRARAMTRYTPIIIISARSIGSCNVQAVLETLGNGGGNGATAGAQIKGKPLQEVLKELIAAIDAFYS